MKQILKIVSCHDCMMWYHDMVGNFVPFIREQSDCYMSREPAGYANIVKKIDAIIVEVEDEIWAMVERDRKLDHSVLHKMNMLDVGT